MGINPLKLMQLKDAWMQFNRRHPKLAPFFRAIQAKALKEGTVIEMKVTTPEGKSLVAASSFNGSRHGIVPPGS